jgi:hypothetical protein
MTVFQYSFSQYVSPMPDFSIDPVALFNAFAARVADEKAAKLRLNPKPKFDFRTKPKVIDFTEEENGD